MVVLNDTILGITEDTSITIGDIDRSVENTISLIPLGDDIRGEAVDITLPSEHGAAKGATTTVYSTTPKAPNSGRR